MWEGRELKGGVGRSCMYIVHVRKGREVVEWSGGFLVLFFYLLQCHVCCSSGCRGR